MITEIALSAQTLEEISANEDYGYGATTLWEALLGSIWSHGSVVFASPDELQRIRELLDGDTLTIPEKQQLGTLIAQLHKEGRLDVRANSDAEIETLQTILPLIGLLPQKTFAEKYPDSSTGTHQLTQTLETSVSAALRQTQILTSFRTIAEAQNFPSGTNRETIWNDLFLTLTECFNRISICDRYLLSEMSYRDSRTVSAEWHTPEHLAWLLTHIDHMCPQGTHVALYTQIDDPSRSPDGPTNADDIIDLIDRQWTDRTGGRIGAIEIYAVQWRSRIHPHNRHIRFGESLAFKLDEGLDRLADETVKFDAGFSYSYLWRRTQVDKLRDDEELIRKTDNLSRTEWNPHELDK